MTVTNTGANAVETTKSSDAGTYSLLNLNPGTYSVTVTATPCEELFEVLVEHHQT